MSSFNSLSQKLIDTWLHSNTTAEHLCAEIVDGLSVRMALSVVTTVADNPYDWHFRRVKDFGFKSGQMDELRQGLPDASLRDLDRSFVDDAIIPAYTQALQVRRPTLALVRTKLLGSRIGYERLILPQKCDGKPAWCVSFVEGRFLVSWAKEAKTDSTDDNIIQLLIEGQSTKEVASSLNLSPRTIEHRIDRLKERFEARNLVHLIGKLVAAKIGYAKHG